jgi:hypothetical protein
MFQPVHQMCLSKFLRAAAVAQASAALDLHLEALEARLAH